MYQTSQTIAFACTNLALRWDTSVAGTCWPQHTAQLLGYVDAALNIATDIFFALVIPVPLFWNLNVNRYTRISLIAILGLGIFACIASIIKSVYLYNLGNYSDWLWDARNITIWNVTELNTGIVAGSLPAIRPLFRQFSEQSEGRENAYRISHAVNGAFDPQNNSIVRWDLRRPKNRVTEDSSSEKAFNLGAEEGHNGTQATYELDTIYGAGRNNECVVTSDTETTAEMGTGGGNPIRGIRKTITATTTFQKVDPTTAAVPVHMCIGGGQEGQSLDRGNDE